MYNYNKLGEVNAIINEIASTHPASEMAQVRKDLYNDMNFNNLIEANEASIDENTGKGKLAAKLWEDCMKDYSSKFGIIPKSCGDITKFADYDTLKISIDYVNKVDSDYQLSTVKKPVTNHELTQTNIQRMNKLHDILISYKADFVYGFRANMGVIKNAYCCLVCALIDVTCINIASLTDYLGKTPGEDISAVNIKLSGNSMKFLKSVDKICALFDDGTWRKLITSIRRNGSKSFTGTSASVAAIIVMIAGAPIAIIALIYFIRVLIAFYYNSAANIRDKCKSLAEYIDEASRNEEDPSALYKQNKVRNKLESLSGFITSRLLKEADTGIDMVNAANKEIDVTTYVSPEERAQIDFF